MNNIIRTIKLIEKFYNAIIPIGVKVLKIIVYGVISLFITTLVLLHIPNIQAKILQHLLDKFNTSTSYHISCTTLRLTWFQHITLENIEIRDNQKNFLFTLTSGKGKLNLLRLLFQKPTAIESISLTGGHIYLRKNMEQKWNVETFYSTIIASFLPQEATDLSIRNIQLNNCNIYSHDAIDLSSIAIENICLSLHNFISTAHYHSGNISYLSLSYKDNNALYFTLKNGATKFHLTSHTLALEECQLFTPQSSLQGDFTLKHLQNLPLFSLFSDKKNGAIEAIIKESSLSSTELEQFLDFFKNKNTFYKINGIIALTSHSIEWENCEIACGSLNTYIKSKGSFYAAPHNKTFNLFIEKGFLDLMDIRPYLTFSNEKFTTYLENLKFINLAAATFIGNADKGTLAGHFSTNIGSVKANIAIENLDKPLQYLIYNGTIALDKVNIHTITPNLPITSLTGDFTIKGKWFNLKKATLESTARIAEMHTGSYTYQDILASCTYSNSILAFHLNSKDPNAKLNITGNYHFKEQGNLKAQATIDGIRLEKLGFVNFPIEIKTKLLLDLKHIQKKLPQGHIAFNHWVLKSLEKETMVEQITIDSMQNNLENILTFSSPYIDCKLKGVFTINDLLHHTKQFIQYLAQPSLPLSVSSAFKITYDIHCKNLSPLLDQFFSYLYISPSTILSGYLTYDTTYHFALNISPKATISFKQIHLDNISLNLTASHLTNHKKRFVQLNLSSKKQNWYKKLQTHYLRLQLLMDKNAFTISHSIEAPSLQSKLSMEYTGNILNNTLHINVLPSRLTTGAKIWSIEAEKASVVSLSEISIGNVSIVNKNESLFIGGSLATSTNKPPLHCMIRNLTLDYLPESIKKKIKGIINAEFTLRSYQNTFIPSGILKLEECTLGGHPIGTITTQANWDRGENKVIFNGNLQQVNKKLLKIKGCYYTKLKQNNWDITATFKKMNLSLFTPLAAPHFSDINGELSGKFHLTGNLFYASQINGKGKIEKGRVTIDYLNTQYEVTGDVKVHKNILYLNQLSLYDKQEGHATLSGHIALQKEFFMELSGKMEDFHLLHTLPQPDSEFYGELYGTGNVHMQGPIKGLILTINATMHKGTFTIVSQDKENIESSTKLVRFISKNKKNKSKSELSEKNTNEGYFKTILDLTVLPTVKTKFLFSSYNSGDIIEGNGHGKIQLTVGLHRSPYIMGNYTFHEGSCTISVFNLIQKTFTIKPNSQIIFNGYPQEWVMHVAASCTQMASIGSLSSQDKNNSQAEIPTEITLSADGNLINPIIKYSLSFPIKSADKLAEKVEEYALLDTTYRNRQILSLLIAKRIYHVNDSADSVEVLNSTLNTILNDLLARHMPNWISKVDQKLAIEANLNINKGYTERNLLEKTKIKVSYLLLSDRLRLSSTMGGYSKFINDWEVFYQLSKMDNMHLKLYQQPIEDKPSSLIGLSFMFTSKFW